MNNVIKYIENQKELIDTKHLKKNIQSFYTNFRLSIKLNIYLIGFELITGEARFDPFGVVNCLVGVVKNI